MRASEARAITNKQYSDQTEEIFPLILKAAESGESQIELLYPINKHTKYILEDLYYKIMIGDKRTNIYW